MSILTPILSHMFTHRPDTPCAAFGQPMRITKIFVERLFEEVIYYQSKSSSPRVGNARNAEMDFRHFLDLVLAFDNLKSNSQTLKSAAISYFWNILDSDKGGYLNRKMMVHVRKDVMFSVLCV